MAKLLNSKHTFDGKLTLVLDNKQYVFKHGVMNLSFYDSSPTIESLDLTLKIEDNGVREALSSYFVPLSVKSPKTEYSFSMKKDKLEELGKEYRKDFDIQKILKVGNMACFYLDNYEFTSFE